MRHVLLLATLLAAPLVHAQAGDLDRTFDDDGKVNTAFAPGDFDNVRAVAVQDDGRIVVAGYSGTTYSIGDDTAFALARYFADGSLDAGFGIDGRVITHFGDYLDAAHAIAVQPDGRIVVAGEAHRAIGAATVGDFALARYDPDGSLDMSFGEGGRVITTFGTNAHAAARGLGIQDDGRIVVAGYALVGGTTDFVLARYDASGKLDAAFDGDGVVTTAFGLGVDAATAVALQPDGRIVAAGFSHDGSSYDFALARYDPDGSLDAGFGSGGRVTTDFGAGHAQAFALALQPDGRVVVAGFASSGSGEDFALARYDAAGALDVRFGDDGRVTTDFGTNFGTNDDRALAVVVQPDGRIVAAGTTLEDTVDAALARYAADGSLDADFDGDGKVITAFGPGTDAIIAIALQRDGRIVAAGYSSNGSNDDFALARYYTDAVVSVSAAPVAPPVVIPADGGTFHFTLTLANATGQPQTATVWTEANGPAAYRPILGPRTVTLAPYATRTWTRMQRVPADSPAGGYVYTVHVADGYDVSATSASFPIGKAGRGPARAGGAAREAFALSPPAPHPFRETARMTLTVPSPQAVRVTVYDALGRAVTVLHDGPTTAGTHELTLDGVALASGVYTVSVEGEDAGATSRVVRY